MGGTTVRAAVADMRGRILTEISLPTFGESGDHSLPDTLQLAADQVLQQGGSEDAAVRAVALGVPGVFDRGSEAWTLAPNTREQVTLRALRDLSLYLHAPVIVENDTNVAALAEWRLGMEGRPPTMVYLAVGTGIGAGIICGGRLLRGRHGLAGEVAYMALQGGARALRTDPAVLSHGELEFMASGFGLAERFRRYAGHSKPCHSAREVLAEAERGDPVAERVVAEAVEALALAIHNLACVLDPHVMVLGGGVSRSDGFVRRVTHEVQRLAPPPVVLVRGKLGTRAGVLGAVELALDWVRAQMQAGSPKISIPSVVHAEEVEEWISAASSTGWGRQAP